ncbi:RHS repeat domain-containing protein, partial [Chryseobacterium wangxinyae]|uniref:RHS repeat domain-containing protein n=1 Tax=Chryseobacterium sp. CY353 TaxID=2997334 RepID=UPI002275B990
NQVEGLQTPDTSDPSLEVLPRYNGNIAEVDWKTSTQENEPLKTYGYVYDGLNRLSAGFYQNETNSSIREYYEKVTYDLNGNIKTMKRTAQRMGPTALLIDNLSYQYENANVSNRLQKISDAVTLGSGYPYKANPTNIGYDDNGNITSFADKGISSIQYNYLNLPKQITQNSVITNYTYRADGIKLKKLYNDVETDYLDGFQYKFTYALEDETETMQNDEMKLRIIPTSEGYYDALLNLYVYNYTDHLGNVRIGYSDSDHDGNIRGRDERVRHCTDSGYGYEICSESFIPGEVVASNTYYPFGMLFDHQYQSNNSNAYKYKFQGQELQETGWYSFKWRNYMPDVGRFFNIDPLAEKFTYNSPYAFAENRVIDGRELEGLEWVSSRNLETKTVNLHLTYKPVNNTVGALSDAQMSALLQDREAQIVSSFGGKDSAGNQVNITFSQSDKSTMVWDYNIAYDTNNVDDFKGKSQEFIDNAVVFTNGMTDTNNNTQTNRTQINVYTTTGLGADDAGYVKSDNKGRADVAKTGAHETGHTLGIKHDDKATLKSSPDNLMRDGGPGTKITPEQRTNAINLVEQQQPKTR